MEQMKSIILKVFYFSIICLFLTPFIDSYNSQTIVDEDVNKKRISGSNAVFQTDFAINSDGDIFILYDEFNPDNENNSYDIIFKRSTDGGLNFDLNYKLNKELLGDQYGCRIAIGLDGVIHAIWQDSLVNNLVYSHSKDNGVTFTEPKLVSDKGIDSVLYEFAVYNSNIYILTRLTSGVEYGYYLIKSNDNGESFSDPVLMGTSNGYQIKTDIKGNVYIKNWVYSSSNSYLLKSTDNGNTFSDPLLICTDESIKGRANIDIDNEGNVYAVWTDIGSRQMIFIAVKHHNVTSFSEPKVLTYIDCDFFYLDIEVDRWNGIYIAFSVIQAEKSRICTIYSSDMGVSFSNLIDISDPIDSWHIYSKIEYDNKNHLYITWDIEINNINEYYLTKINVPNHSPYIDNYIPTICFDEDSNTEEVVTDLKEYFDDDQGKNNIYFELKNQRPSEILEPIFQEGNLSFSQILKNWHGDVIFDLYCYDFGEDGIMGNSDDQYIKYRDFTINIIPTNDKPEIINIGSNMINENNISIPVVEDVKFEEKVEYIEYDGDNVTIEIITLNPRLYINNYDNTINFLPIDDDVGYINCTISVTDSNNSKNSYNLSFNVKNVNDPPMIIENDINIEMDEDHEYVIDDLSCWIIDVDEDILSYKFINGLNVDMKNGDNGTFIITPTENYFGSDSISILISDNEYQVELIFNITINPINDPPQAKKILFNEEIYIEGNNQSVTGVAFDEEDEEYDLIFNWYANGNHIGSGKDFDLDLPQGQHNITLEVIDSNNATDYIYSMIEIEEKEKRKDPSYIFLLLPLILILILIIVIFVIILVLVKKTKRTLEKENSNGNLNNSNTNQNSDYPDNGIIHSSEGT